MTLDPQNSIAGDSSTDIASLASWDNLSESSTTMTTNTPGNSHDGRREAQQQQPHKTRTLAPNLTRRAHKKSRGGCYSCKSRKIKCNEQKPVCGSCVIKGLTCVYPAEPVMRHNSSGSNSNSNGSTSHTLSVLRRNPTTGPSFPGTGAGEAAGSFSMVDMRFFHHFLTIAYPHLPVDNDAVWVHEIPQFAEQHGYLMHAILSLGASHLSRLTGVDYRRESLVHRGHAFAGLNQALSQTARAYGESDAMLASCYALTFQASYMGDGLTDFIAMVRGCALTTEKIQQENAPTAFNLDPDYHFKVMAPRLHQLPAIHPQLLQDADVALEAIRPYVTGDTEIDFHDAMVDVVTNLQASPADGYLQFINIYGVWCELCHDSFQTFLDPNNLVAQLLLAYFVCLQLLMVPLAVQECQHRADATRVRVLSGTVEWAHAIFKCLDGSELSVHLEWPRKIIAIVVAEIDGQVPQWPSVLQLQLATRDVSPQSTILVPP